MKNFFRKSVFCICLSCALLAGLVQGVYAAGISVSAGQSSVSVGNTVAFTVTVPSGSEAWTYNVSYSDNLSLQSGDTQPLGFQGANRSNTLIFRANSTGTGKVTITSGSYCINGVDYNASGSASVSIVAASTPSQGYSHTDYEDEGSSENANSALATLTASAGTLSPAFAPDVTEYKLSLPVKTEKVTLTATPSDSSAKVEGAGEIALKTGENTVSIVVTAENGEKTTYTVHAVVAQMPTVFMEYNGEKLGVVADVADVTAPTGFAPTTVTYNGSAVPAWTNAKKTVTLLYLMDQQYKNTFYAYSAADGIMGLYLPLTVGSETYVYTGVPKKQQEFPGLAFGSVNAFGQTLDGFTYQDEALSDFCVLYLMDSEGNYGFFNYDSQSKTLQRFTGAVYPASDTELMIPWLYVYIAGGAAVAMLLVIILLAAVSAGRKKKLRAIPEDIGAIEADSEIREIPELPEQETVETAAPPALEKPTKVPSGPIEATPSIPETSTAPEEEGAPIPEPEAPMQEQTAEDAYRTLSLNELLDDIRNL